MFFNIYSDRGGENKAINTVKYQWIRSILEQTGVDWEDCFSENNIEKELTILQKAKTRKKLQENNLYVHDNMDGEISIYIGDEIIAKWEKPIFRIKFDGSKIKKSEKWFSEIDINCWSVFDEDLGEKNE